MVRIKPLLLATLCVPAVCMTGCGGNSLGRLPISGEVKFNGKLLDKGTVQFRPVDQQGVASGASVVNGKYQITEAKGLPPGKYSVRIFSSKDDTSPLPEGVPPGVMRPSIEQIPPEYNTQTTQSVVVTNEGPNQFNFDIAGK